MLKNIYVML